MKRLRWVLLFVALYASPAVAQEEGPPPAPEPDAPVVQQAEAAAQLFREDPERAVEGGYETLFAPSFLNQIPEARLKRLIQRLFSQHGAVTDVQTRQLQSATRGRFYFVFEKGYRVPADLTVARQPPHRIEGYRLHPPEPLDLAGSLEEVTEQLAALPGEGSFLLAEIGTGGDLEPLAAHRPEAAAAIGSAFKLYVLGALVRAVETSAHGWSDVVQLEAGQKSLPSGTLHTWPTGAPVTLHTLTTLMISRSDNTATDALLRALGREAVEEAQAAMGHARPALNQPFLTTRELFVLKSDDALAERYLTAGEAGRRVLLAGNVAAVERETILAQLDFSKPNRIAELEWFASAQDLARAMAWFYQDGEARAAARAILAVNPGLDFDDERWRYVGFKGGSESGVLNTTFLLQDADGMWYALAASQNDPEAAVDQTQLFSLVKQAARLTE